MLYIKLYGMDDTVHLKTNYTVKKGKVVPLHAVEVLWVRGGIAPTLSEPQH
jgi:hypothetical protein